MIEFRNVSQSYKDHKVLTDINMTIKWEHFRSDADKPASDRPFPGFLCPKFQL